MTDPEAMDMPEPEVAADDVDGDDGPYEGAEEVDPHDIPEQEIPEIVLKGETEALGDDLVGDEDDDSWLDEEDTVDGDFRTAGFNKD